MNKRPYDFQLLHELDLGALLVSLVTLLFVLLFLDIQDRPNLDANTRVGLGGLVIFINMAFMIWFARKVWKDVQAKLKGLLRNVPNLKKSKEAPKKKKCCSCCRKKTPERNEDDDDEDAFGIELQNFNVPDDILSDQNRRSINKFEHLGLGLSKEDSKTLYQIVCTKDVQSLAKQAGLLFLHGLVAAFVLSTAESGVEKFAFKDIQSNYDMLSPALNLSVPDYEVSCLTSSQRQILENYFEAPPLAGNWNYPSAVFFCITLFTTIGYGTFAPQTVFGKFYTCILAIAVLVRMSPG